MTLQFSYSFSCGSHTQSAPSRRGAALEISRHNFDKSFSQAISRSARYTLAILNIWRLVRRISNPSCFKSPSHLKSPQGVTSLYLQVFLQISLNCPSNGFTSRPFLLTYNCKLPTQCYPVGGYSLALQNCKSEIVPVRFHSSLSWFHPPLSWYPLRGLICTVLRR
jgi:hypothetical protein